MEDLHGQKVAANKSKSRKRPWPTEETRTTTQHTCPFSIAEEERAREWARPRWRTCLKGKSERVRDGSNEMRAIQNVKSNKSSQAKRHSPLFGLITFNTLSLDRTDVLLLFWGVVSRRYRHGWCCFVVVVDLWKLWRREEDRARFWKQALVETILGSTHNDRLPQVCPMTVKCQPHVETILDTTHKDRWPQLCPRSRWN